MVYFIVTIPKEQKAARNPLGSKDDDSGMNVSPLGLRTNLTDSFCEMWGGALKPHGEMLSGGVLSAHGENIRGP